MTDNKLEVKIKFWALTQNSQTIVLMVNIRTFWKVRKFYDLVETVLMVNDHTSRRTLLMVNNHSPTLMVNNHTPTLMVNNRTSYVFNGEKIIPIK